jgi:hypothetical protein
MHEKSPGNGGFFARISPGKRFTKSNVALLIIYYFRITELISPSSVNYMYTARSTVFESVKI